MVRMMMAAAVFASALVLAVEPEEHNPPGAVVRREGDRADARVMADPELFPRHPRDRERCDQVALEYLGRLREDGFPSLRVGARRAPVVAIHGIHDVRPRCQAKR